MHLDSLLPWKGAVVALAAALVWAGLLRLAGRRDLAALGAGAGLALGWVVVLGLPTASPRQLAERLPMLALAGLMAGLVLSLLGRGRAWVAGGVALMVLGAGWWLAGAPLDLADLRRGGLALLALVLLVAALLEASSPARAGLAAALLLAGIWMSAPFGPWRVLAAAALAAALGGFAGGGVWGLAATLPIAAGLAGLAAGPLLGRGAAVDWLTAAAPVAALWLGPVLGARLGGRFGLPLGWMLAGGLPLLLIWLILRGL